MAFSKGNSSVCLSEILDRVTESEILSFYLGITEVPCIIRSPLRQDNRPSFGFYSNDGKKISYKDLATQDSGGLFDLLSKMWGTTFLDTITKVYSDIPKMTTSGSIREYKPCSIHSTSSYNRNSDLQCKVREWRKYDEEYWNSYGVPIEWLKYAEVYPISYKIIIKDGKKYTFAADKYAYVYVEHKEGKVTLKIYQPYNKEGYKWTSKHDSSVISLWTKVPEYGNKICICSSMKDALCLRANIGIPTLATQGEGYNISDTAINELKRRYKQVYILFDGDTAGILDSKKLSEQTGFTNIEFPKGYGVKDISDLFHSLQDQQKFISIMKPLFN